MTHSLLMNRPNLRLCSSSHAFTAEGDSGAGPYSMFLKTSSNVLISNSKYVRWSSSPERAVRRVYRDHQLQVDFSFHAYFSLLVSIRIGKNTQSYSTIGVLSHRHVVLGGVVTGNEVIQLSLEVSQQTACADAEEIRHQPFVTEFFFHQRLPCHGLLGITDSTCGLEANFVSCALKI